MSKKLQVGDEIFEYPVNGSSNYGEEATGWADEVTEALKEVKGPGDISTTETILSGTSGDIAGLQFDTSFVQRVFIEGLLKREFNTSPTKYESFTIEAIYNGSNFLISPVYVGDDTNVTFDVTGGQFTFSTVADPDDAPNGLTIKYKAKAIIDESAL
jgi:hypothetical protein